MRKTSSSSRLMSWQGRGGLGGCSPFRIGCFSWCLDLYSISVWREESWSHGAVAAAAVVASPKSFKGLQISLRFSPGEKKEDHLSLVFLFRFHCGLSQKKSISDFAVIMAQFFAYFYIYRYSLHLEGFWEGALKNLFPKPTMGAQIPSGNHRESTFSDRPTAPPPSLSCPGEGVWFWHELAAAAPSAADAGTFSVTTWWSHQFYGMPPFPHFF